MDRDLIERYHDLAFKEKTNFLAFINILGEAGIKKLYKFPGEDFSLWWFSLVAEKSPYKTDSYNRLISFLLSKKEGLHKPFRIKFSIKGTFCCQYILGVREFFRFLCRILYIKINIQDFKSRKEKLFKSDWNIVSYFPSINKEAAKRDIFENQFISPFHRVLEQEKAASYSHMLIQVVIDNYGLKDSLDLVRRFKEHQSLFFIEEFFKIKHIFKFVYYYFYFLFKFLLNFFSIRKKVRYEFEGASYDIWPILKRDFFRSFCGEILVSSIWYILLFKEMISSLKKKSKIICTSEMQWWEKPIYIFAKKQGINTIGYQHSIIPALLLNYFNDKREIGSDDYVKSCPLPDYMATVGKIPAGLFREFGWGKKRVLVWGAQRFYELRNLDKSKISWDKRENHIVVAFSIDPIEAQKIIIILSEAFKEITNYKIVLKSHPSLDLRKIVKNLGVELPPAIFSYTERNLFDLMHSVKGMIVTESTSSLFAIAYGLPLIVPRFMNKIDCNPLSYITDIPVYVYSSDELTSVCKKIISSEPSTEYREKCRNALSNYLYFPDNEFEYLKKIALL